MIPTSRAGRVVAAVGALALAAVLALGVRAWIAERRSIEEIRALRERVLAARGDAESCRTDLAREEVGFREFDARVDSLRTRVAAYEQARPGGGRGVDGERYGEYLDEVARYNAAVEEWEARADSLRRAEEACRTRVERHNLLTDSLRTRLEAEGIGP